MELHDLIASVDLIEYASNFLELTQANDEFVALCPFHDEKTGSLTFTPKTQLFYCFGCGAGGNIINFIQKYNNCTTGQAIQALKKHCNITEETVEWDKKLPITNIIKSYDRKNYRTKPTVSKNKLSPDIMDVYENNRDKLRSWYEEGISYEVMSKYQVRYDPMSDRIVYPIRDIDGNIISVKGRTLDVDFKEKKIRKYTYYHKIGELNCLYGYYEHFNEIKEQNEVIIFEGEKSVLLTETWGIKNTLAIYTSHLNYSQLLILIKLGVRVVFALDNDVDIKNDTNIQKLKRYVTVEHIKDTHMKLAEKDAPVDCGLSFWLTLYNERRSVC